jgi:superfamily II DNA or RNA helicase
VSATYREFLEQKIVSTPDHGWSIEAGAVNPICKPHQRAIIEWAVRGGRRAIFAKFGLGKTVIMLEIMRLILEKHTDGVALIIIPARRALGVSPRCRDARHGPSIHSHDRRDLGPRHLPHELRKCP